jgi:hypothetical protein
VLIFLSGVSTASIAPTPDLSGPDLCCRASGRDLLDGTQRASDGEWGRRRPFGIGAHFADLPARLGEVVGELPFSFSTLMRSAARAMSALAISDDPDGLFVVPREVTAGAVASLRHLCLMASISASVT